MMELACPRCRIANPEVARFCRRCGLALVRGPDGSLLGPGQIRHPQPLAAPPGFQCFDDTPDLFFSMKSAWGGQALSDTEPRIIVAFNAGYSLVDVIILIRGHGPAGEAAFCIPHAVERWGRGQTVTLEVPSWELPDEPHELTLALESAEFDAEN
ncbi:MAG: hypothetical protein KBH81_03080 [Phycisphaerae bacterium]|jgi:hypothetical protein|nr:hypothetical protein [Phycisphaerae bacterium]